MFTLKFTGPCFDFKKCRTKTKLEKNDKQLDQKKKEYKDLIE